MLKYSLFSSPAVSEGLVDAVRNLGRKKPPNHPQGDPNNKHHDRNVMSPGELEKRKDSSREVVRGVRNKFLKESYVRDEHKGPLRYDPETRMFHHATGPAEGQMWHPEHYHEGTTRHKTDAMREHGIHLTGRERQLFDLDPHGHLSGPQRADENAQDVRDRHQRVLDHLYGGMDEPEHKIVPIFHTKLHRKLVAARDRHRFEHYE